MRVFNDASTKEKRRRLKNEMTDAEKLLWKHIRVDSLGIRFRRQYGIGNYIADFYCPELKIIIELDGSQHHSEEGREYDRVRDEYMRSLGIKTIRFDNIDVFRNFEGVLESIKYNIESIRNMNDNDDT